MKCFTAACEASNLTGGCLCGAVRYEASGPTVDTCGYRHCRMCQKAYGNGFGTFVDFPRDAFRFTRGEPKLYKFSDIAERGFCADCSSPLIMRYFSGGWIRILIGTLDHLGDMREALKGHTGIESDIPWLTIHDDLPRSCTEDDPDIAAVMAAGDEGEE